MWIDVLNFMLDLIVYGQIADLFLEYTSKSKCCTRGRKKYVKQEADALKRTFSKLNCTIQLHSH